MLLVFFIVSLIGFTFYILHKSGKSISRDFRKGWKYAAYQAIAHMTVGLLLASALAIFLI